MAESQAEKDTLMALDLEYRLTIAHRIDCECAPYLARRREALIPAVLEQAATKGEDPVDTFVAFARRVHARHASNATTFSVGRYVALMAALGTDPEGSDR